MAKFLIINIFFLPLDGEKWSYEKGGKRMLLLAFMWYSAHELDSSAERVQSIKKGRAFSVLP